MHKPAVEVTLLNLTANKGSNIYVDRVVAHHVQVIHTIGIHEGNGGTGTQHTQNITKRDHCGQ